MHSRILSQSKVKMTSLVFKDAVNLWTAQWRALKACHLWAPSCQVPELVGAWLAVYGEWDPKIVCCDDTWC